MFYVVTTREGFSLSGLPTTTMPLDLPFSSHCACSSDKEPSPDLYVVGSQETGSFKEWKEQLQEVLGPGYTRLASHSLLQIGLVVFVRKMLRHRCSHVRKDAVPTGACCAATSLLYAIHGHTYM